MIFTEEKNENYKILSKTLPSIFQMCNIDINKKILLKIDCEACEKYLLHSQETVSIMQRCEHIIIEFHFPSIDNDETAKHYPTFLKSPSWVEYEQWLKENFITNHKIETTFLRTRTGFATVVLKKCPRNL